MNTNSTTCTKLALHIASFLLSTIAFVQPVVAGNEVFSITPSDARRNLYAIIENTFDSTIFSYAAGEFKLIRSGVKTPIPYTKFDLTPEFQRGDSNVGVDQVLSTKFSTDPFVITSGDSISFFREALVVPAGCEYAGTAEEPPAYGQAGPFPNTWKVAMGSVEDTSVVIVRVEKLSDTSIYMNIDTVMIFPNPSSQYVLHSGTNVDALDHKRPLPSGMTGYPVRLRIIVERYGPSPLGMCAQWMPERIARSATMTRSYTTSFKLSPSQADSIENKYNELVEQYIDAVAGTTNDFPAIGHLRLEDTTFVRIMSKHYNITYDSVGNIQRWYTPKKLFMDTAGLYLVATPTVRPSYVKAADSLYGNDKSSIQRLNGAHDGIWIVSLKFDKTNGVINLTTIVPSWSNEVLWTITDLQGRTISSGYLWPGFHGRGELQLPFFVYSNQPYFITLIETARGTRTSLGITP